MGRIFVMSEDRNNVFLPPENAELVVSSCGEEGTRQRTWKVL
jgi:hypothetical protein